MPEMSKTILAVVHRPESSMGRVGHLLREAGHRLDVRCPASGDPLPADLDSHDAVVVFGGAVSANDDALPFIRAELDWLPLVLKAEKPFFGICLGAQLLARSLGARVASRADERREIGYYPIDPTAEGSDIFDPEFWVYHWHGEGFDLPPDATLLARGELFGNQAYAYGGRAVGVQFHPEITRPMLLRWTQVAARQLDLPGAQSRERQLEYCHRFDRQMTRWLRRFLGYWLDDRVSSPLLDAQRRSASGPTSHLGPIAAR